MIDLEIVADPSDTEAEAVVGILVAHGEEHGVFWDQTKLHIVLREDGRIVGGLVGDTVLNWLYIGRLAVAPELRGAGHGRKLMQEAERIARERGCEGIWLNTFSFQAPDFYRSLGYREFGRLDRYPDNHSRCFFAKYLNEATDRDAPRKENG